MRTFIKNHKLPIYIFLLILISGFFRFYNLSWGSPFYFHPDERNIASSIANINFPNQMNPHFFAYGSFPIYLIYFTSFIMNLFSKSQDLFIQSILISRFYSAILSLLIIPSIYFIGKKLYDKKIGLIAAVLSTFSIGFTQFAHFGTFEMWLTFLGLWLFYFSLKLTKDLNLKNIIIVGAIFGLLMATKISSLPLLAIPLMSVFLNHLSKIKSFKLSTHNLFMIFLRTTAIACIALLFFMIISPYVLIDFTPFLSSIKYESSVAFGTLPVFYTGEFFNSIPIIFQFTRIYPFLLNPLITVIFIPSLIYITFIAFKKNNFSYYLLFTIYYLLFLPHAFLFAKWTRYIVPTLPFMHLIIAISFFDFIKFLNRKMRPLFNYQYTGISLIVIASFIFTSSYFITAFVKKDTRIEASLWAKENILVSANILSEVYDMGIVPFNQHLQNITLFNFYDLDQTLEIKKMELKNVLSESEYIILPSQRILKSRFLNKNKFPVGNKFYKDLLEEKMKYRKVYETPCDIFCKITYMGDPIFSFEETASVFDRPTVFIFRNLNIKN